MFYFLTCCFQKCAKNSSTIFSILQSWLKRFSSLILVVTSELSSELVWISFTVVYIQKKIKVIHYFWKLFCIVQVIIIITMKNMLPGYLDPLAIERHLATMFLQYVQFLHFWVLEISQFYLHKDLLLVIFYHLGSIWVLFMQVLYLAISLCDPLTVLSDQPSNLFNGIIAARWKTFLFITLSCHLMLMMFLRQHCWKTSTCWLLLVVLSHVLLAKFEVGAADVALFWWWNF